MVIGSHNSWTFLTPRKWWMKLIAFTARCQRYSISFQYTANKARCFDLRVRYKENGEIILAHGIIEYQYTIKQLVEDLEWLRFRATMDGETIYIRVINEVRKESQHTEEEKTSFVSFCSWLEKSYPELYIFDGDNLVDYTPDYNFRNPYPPMEELYASVQPPKLLDDWWPWLYARLHNKKNIAKGTDKDIMMIDFVNIQ